jgi:photosystem II stability/assembly factor-like uncharacterized protein
MAKQKNSSFYGAVKSKTRVLFLIIFVPLFLGAGLPGCSLFGGQTAPKDGGVFKSMDGGLSWEAKNNLTPPPGSKAQKMDITGVNIISLAVDPADSGIVYAGSEGNGLLKSIDAGDNWELYTGQNMRSNENIYYIAIDSKDSKKIYVAGLSAANKGRVLKSEDGGQNWSETYVTLAAGDLVSQIKIDNYNTGVVYIATSSGGIFQSIDYGKSWTLLRRAKGGVNNIAINPRDTRILYFTTGQEGIFKSTDRGLTWISLSEKNESLKDLKVNLNTKFDSVVIDPQSPDNIYLGYINGLLKSTDGGSNWTPVNIITPPALLPMASMTISENNPNNIYYTINSQVYFTSNGAESDWIVRDLPTSRILQAVTVDPGNSKIIYVGSRFVAKKK